ncbi:MAG TPA: hypothetical protein RMH99_11380 [Sandaracinaceae bacterium LLY-WYZ-13_1]|nr:hypothetical protein [Sandaracinaceae bacterium LLY-WYZ-13_1]
MRFERWLGLGAGIAVLAVVAMPASAEAQGWLADRSRTQGPGIAVGDFELHPGIGVEVGYDSNLYYSPDDPSPEGPERVDSGILRATAHLLFGPRGRERQEEGESAAAGGGSQRDVTFQGGISGSFYTFFEDLERTNMEASANLALGIRAADWLSIHLTEQFGRSVRPFVENTMMDASYARIQNDAGLRLSFQSSGEVLKISTGYRFGINYFEDELFQFGNRFQHELTLSETFRFLPQTGIVHETTVRIVDYFDDTSAGSSLVLNSVMLRSRVGINGALTNNFSVLLAAGYGAGFYDGVAGYEQEYESVVAQVRATWQIERDTRLVFGYDRDFQPSYVGNWFRRDRGHAAFQTIIAGRFLLGVNAAFAYHEFGAIVEPDGMTPVGTTLQRGDFRLIASVFGEYRFTDWLGVNATLRYTGNFTDYAYEVDDLSDMTTFLVPAQFNKFEAWLGVRVFY